VKFRGEFVFHRYETEGEMFLAGIASAALTCVLSDSPQENITALQHWD